MENTLIVHRKGQPECVIVDPGFEPSKIIKLLETRGMQPAAILLTHGHVDHIAGNFALCERFCDLPLIVGRNDAPLLADPLKNLSALGGVSITSPPASRLVGEGDVVDAAGLQFHVRDVPGHSPGHVVYILPGETPMIVLGGDVLFQGSIGRCDFPGGDQELLVRGIRTKLFPLPDDTRVYPGHGPMTTVGAERRTNPFCGDLAGRFAP